MDLARPVSTTVSSASQVSRRGMGSRAMVVREASCHHAFLQKRGLVLGVLVIWVHGWRETHRVFQRFRRDVFERDREVNEIQINVSQAPSLVLGFGCSESMVFLVVVVPEFGDYEDFFALDEAFVDGALDALACFVLVLVVVCAVEEAVADFDGLWIC